MILPRDYIAAELGLSRTSPAAPSMSTRSWGCLSPSAPKKRECATQYLVATGREHHKTRFILLGASQKHVGHSPVLSTNPGSDGRTGRGRGRRVWPRPSLGRRSLQGRNARARRCRLVPERRFGLHRRIRARECCGRWRRIGAHDDSGDARVSSDRTRSGTWFIATPTFRPPISGRFVQHPAHGSQLAAMIARQPVRAVIAPARLRLAAPMIESSPRRRAHHGPFNSQLPTR